MPIQKPRTLSGFMELLPEKQALFDAMVEKLRTVYARYGFASLDTPLMEASEVLLAKGGGAQQISARIPYNEIDMVLAFSDPQEALGDQDLHYILSLCDQYNVPCATNVATAEMLILGLDRGDLDWRQALNPKAGPLII